MNAKQTQSDTRVNSLTWVTAAKTEVGRFFWRLDRPRPRSPTGSPAVVSLTRLQHGGVRERPNRHDWKSCVGQPTVGSNPTSSALGTASDGADPAVSDVPTHQKDQVIGHAREGADFRPAPRRPHTGRIDTPMTSPPPNDDDAMELALAEARAADADGEVPVGAVCLVDGQVVARRHNERERSADPTAHAELLALRDAAAAIGGWRLRDATMVVTLEPCPMCAGALVAARLGRLVYGAADPKAGACGTLYNLCADPRLNHEVDVTGGVRAAECGALLTSFFAGRRNDRARGESFGAGQSD